MSIMNDFILRCHTHIEESPVTPVRLKTSVSYNNSEEKKGNSRQLSTIMTSIAIGGNSLTAFTTIGGNILYKGVNPF